jgi:hypothetical protein
MITFSEFIEKRTAKILPLTVTHSTTITRLKRILKDGKLSPTPCTKFIGENLLYLFYGRADYEPGSILNNHGMINELPATIIFDYNKLTIPIKRLLPFDSGALWDGRYNKWVGELSKNNKEKEEKVKEILDLFSLLPDKEMMCKFVEIFYKSNQNFYHGIMKPEDDALSIHEGKVYFDGVSPRISDETDRRCAAIEIQVENEIIIDANIVKAIIIPSDTTDEIKDELNLKTIKSIIYPGAQKANKAFFMGGIHTRLYDYLVGEGLFR